MNDLVERLRKCAVCVYLAAERGPAEDLAKHLTEAADRIEALEEHKRAQAGDIMTLGMTVGRLEAALREIAVYDPPKPTIEELEALLKAEPADDVHINPDGSVTHGFKAIARRALEGVAEIGKTLGEHMSDRRALEDKT